jgi:hypothetical protein
MTLVLAETSSIPKSLTKPFRTLVLSHITHLRAFVDYWGSVADFPLRLQAAATLVDVYSVLNMSLDLHITVHTHHLLKLTTLPATPALVEVVISDLSLEHLSTMLAAGCFQPSTVQTHSPRLSAVQMAIRHRAFDCAKMLIKYRGDLTHKAIDGSTALHDAVRARASDVVACLLAFGADPRGADRGGITPLHLCRDSGSCRLILERAKLVQESDATLREVLEATDCKGQRAVDVVAYRAPELLEIFAEFGSFPTPKGEGRKFAGDLADIIKANVASLNGAIHV